MKIKVHGNHCHKRGRVFARVIDKTAAATGLDDATILRVSSYLWEYIADEVAGGQVITIPGFGAFGAWRDDRWRTKRPVLPKFEPARHFSSLVRYAVINPSVSKKVMRKYATNHHGVYTARRPADVMSSLRADIARQMNED